MEVIRKEEAAVHSGSTFTGKVQLEEMVNPANKEQVKLTVVRFDNGARTNWHVHPGEQILYVLEGEARVGTETTQSILRPGDAAYAPPGEKHWHGATEGHSMAHLSITTGGSPEWFGPPD